MCWGVDIIQKPSDIDPATSYQSFEGAEGWTVDFNNKYKTVTSEKVNFWGIWKSSTLEQLVKGFSLVTFKYKLNDTFEYDKEYTFDYYFHDAYDSRWNNQAYVGTNLSAIYAEYNVKFVDSDGRSELKTEHVVRGEKAENFTPQKEGYTFKGWSVKEGKGTVSSIDDPIMSVGVVFQANWGANSYTVKFDANSGTGTMDDQNRMYDDGVELTENTFTKAGYTFKGWNTEADGNGTAYADKATANLTSEAGGTVTLYAQWEANEDALTYNANGGEGTTEATTGKVDQNVTVAANGFTKTGYTFTGWNTAANGTGTAYAAGSEYKLTPEEDVLYAQWTANSYTVKFEANTGSGSMADQSRAYDDETALTENVFTKAGYTFKGWNTATDGNGTAYADKATTNLTSEANGTVTLYAQWEANEDTLTYNANGGEGTTEATTGKVDQNVTVAANGFTKTGYTFTGWNTAADGTGTAYDAESTYKLTPEDDVLYAQWTANSYTVKFDANTGSGSMADQSRTYDDGVALTENTFTKAGYTFKCWNTAADGSGTAYDDKATTNLTSEADGTVTLYAQWEANDDTLTYEANGGEGTTEATTGKVDQNVTVAANGFTKTGYTFTGWNTAANGTGTAYAAGSEYKLTPGDDVLYAQWTANSHTVKFDANTGSGSMADQSRTYDDGVALTENTFTKAGYTFKCWNTAADGSGTAYDDKATTNLTSEAGGTVTLYAQWEANEDALTYNANGGEGTTEATTGKVDQEVTVATNGFTKTGYTFTGWNTAADGTGTAYAAESKYKLTPGDDVLYAQWTANSYTVKFDANTGSGSMADQSRTYDDGVALTENTFTKAGYTFKCWNTAADGSGTAYDDKATTNLTSEAGGTVTLYAQWGANDDTLTYNANGGDGTTEATTGKVDQNVIVAVNGFTKTGYTFTGWNTAANGTGTAYAAGSEYKLTPEEDVLYAQWTANNYTVKFDANSGTGTMDDQNRTYDDGVALTENAFTKAGYTFKCWNTAADGSGTAYDDKATTNLTSEANGIVTLYAQWEQDYQIKIENWTGMGASDLITGIDPEAYYRRGTTVSFTVKSDLATAVALHTGSSKEKSQDGTFTRLFGTETQDGYTFSFTMPETGDVYLTLAYKGDVNLNGELQTRDASMAAQASAQLYELTPLQAFVADLDGNNEVQTKEAGQIGSAAAQLVTLGWDISA